MDCRLFAMRKEAARDSSSHRATPSLARIDGAARMDIFGDLGVK